MFRYMKKVSELYATLGLPVWKKKFFFSNNQLSQPRKMADLLRDACHMEAAELFCANVTTKYMQQRYVVFFSRPLDATWRHDIFIFHAVNTNHMPVSK